MQLGNRAEKRVVEKRIFQNKKEDTDGEKTGAKIIPIRGIDEKEIPVRRAGKTPRQKQENGRFIATVCMAVFLCFTMGFCVVQSVRSINSGTQVINLNAPNQVVETNEEGDGKSLDVDALAKKILDNVAFDVELDKLEDSVAEGMISVTDGTKLQIYMGNGTNADEVVLMTALNEKDAEKNQEYVEEHISEIKKQFALYNPKQVRKIDNAVKIRSGCYVIVCITSDTETAKSTIETFLKQ
ncbi:MAG: DUF4358 domain-containing protein [Lachnospiraceae bacterium]|nr:DUF4358 domain-containing protein [Lachnospiraceae bacterium]